MALNTVPYSGLKNRSPIQYPGPTGLETHYYYRADQPSLAAPETGLITTFPLAPSGYVNVLDKFNASVLASDTSQNVILVQFYSIDLITVLWSFHLQMALLIGSPNYTYPTFLADNQWIMTLSFQANSGIFTAENFSFRYRCINKGVD